MLGKIFSDIIVFLPKSKLATNGVVPDLSPASATYRYFRLQVRYEESACVVIRISKCD